jgi:putative DNA methylase
MSYPIKSPRKLIEVALPLDAISKGCQHEKNPFLKGHPRGIHLWWARRPLAVARAILFAQLVNDPGYQQGGGSKYGKNKKEATEERKRLFTIVEDLVLWENTTNEKVLDSARAEIRRSWREVCDLNKDHPQAAELFNPNKLPAFHDPFAGGGAIPLEAQRLGLQTYASDLNPVAVLINKAMIEIPPKFAGRAPIGPLRSLERNTRLNLPEDWSGTAGLAEDVRRYSGWVRDEASRRMSSLYPKAAVTKKMLTERPDLAPMVGQEYDVIAWIWCAPSVARIQRSPMLKSPQPQLSFYQRKEMRMPLFNQMFAKTPTNWL